MHPYILLMLVFILEYLLYFIYLDSTLASSRLQTDPLNTNGYAHIIQSYVHAHDPVLFVLLRGLNLL